MTGGLPPSPADGGAGGPARPLLTAEALLARLLYRDACLLILDKPAGVPVHHGPGGGPNLEALFDALRFGLPRPPALAHRLDRDTSGCLVLGRHRKALARLGRLFAAGRVEKLYWAVVAGTPPAEAGRIDLSLGKRSSAQRGWWMKPDPQGQPAVTDYRRLGGTGDVSWLELRPRTGRTHQIRVHCAALGCPVLGDPIYGGSDRTAAAAEPTHLHARSITLPYNPNRAPITAVAPVPLHMADRLRACGWAGDAPSAGPAP